MDSALCMVHKQKYYKLLIWWKKHLPFDISIEFNVQTFKINYPNLWIIIDYDSYINGRISYHIFQKEFNTYTYLHRDSNHHPSIFKCLYITECTKYKRKHVKTLLELRLHKQCYSYNEMKLWYRNYEIKHKPIARVVDDKVYRYIRITNENALNLHRLARKIVRKYRKNRTYNFRLVFTNNKKLTELTLTIAKLHHKIGKFLL